MTKSRPSKKNNGSSYLLKLEPSASGEHVRLLDLLSGKQLEFDSLEEAQTHLREHKPKTGLR
jgi:hypothetical protein